MNIHEYDVLTLYIVTNCAL